MDTGVATQSRARNNLAMRPAGTRTSAGSALLGGAAPTPLARMPVGPEFSQNTGATAALYSDVVASRPASP
jgi:hypothetical protein